MTRAPGSLGATAAALADASAPLDALSLRAAAAEAGAEVGVIACARLRARFADLRRGAAEERAGAWWLRAPVEARQLLLAMATDREETSRAALMPWRSFTGEERASMRVYAVWLRASLDGVECLTR